MTNGTQTAFLALEQAQNSLHLFQDGTDSTQEVAEVQGKLAKQISGVLSDLKTFLESADNKAAHTHKESMREALKYIRAELSNPSMRRGSPVYNTFREARGLVETLANNQDLYQFTQRYVEGSPVEKTRSGDGQWFGWLKKHLNPLPALKALYTNIATTRETPKTRAIKHSTLPPERIQNIIQAYETGNPRLAYRLSRQSKTLPTSEQDAELASYEKARADQQPWANTFKKITHEQIAYDKEVRHGQRILKSIEAYKNGDQEKAFKLSQAFPTKTERDFLARHKDLQKTFLDIAQQAQENMPDGQRILESVAAYKNGDKETAFGLSQVFPNKKERAFLAHHKNLQKAFLDIVKECRANRPAAPVKRGAASTVELALQIR